MKNRLVLFFSLIFCVLLLSTSERASAAPLDEILEYSIKVDVQDDATLKMNYHIKWKVLDSTSEGPLEWVKIGIPNAKISNLKTSSSCVSKIRYYSDNGHFVRLDFKKSYKKGEVVSFDFSFVQDYMYQMNEETEGVTVYSFTPGWFDDITVDCLSISWNADRVQSCSANSLLYDGYYIWEGKLPAGHKVTVRVMYDNDAYNFSKEKSDDYEKTNKPSKDLDAGGIIAVTVFIMGAIVIASNRKSYSKNSGFSATETKITRTKIVYYSSCPGCGAQREDGQTQCKYCNRSLVKSEETIREEEVPKEELDSIKKFNKDGEYPFSSSPNTYIRVHVTHVPVKSTRSSGSHSCAHSSCACACACACAGGGRAGCTNKDFYRTGLKLRRLAATIDKSKKNS